MIRMLILWYSQVVLKFLKDNEKKLFRNLERSTLKLERNNSHLMFNETCYYKYIYVMFGINAYLEANKPNSIVQSETFYFYDSSFMTGTTGLSILNC